MAAALESSGEAVLRTEGVGKRFPIIEGAHRWRLVLGLEDASSLDSVEALRDISFAVPPGQFVGVIGRNGAGKSTLLRVLGGVYEPTSGRIWRPPHPSGVFELGGFGGALQTGRELASRLLYLDGLRGDALERAIAEVRAFSELDDYFERPIRTYSTGMSARLHFAATTVQEYDAYLLDEALVVGDEHFQGKCWRWLRGRVERGAPGVIVSHDWTAILRLCPQCVLLEEGRAKEFGPSAEVVRSYLGSAPVFRREGAGFVGLPDRLTARSGEQFQFTLDVRLTVDEPVALAWSIEVLDPGRSWELLLLGNDLVVGERAGEYRLTVGIPDLPLSPGSYFLNVGLGSRLGARGVSHAYDVRGWIHGNPIGLEVSGDRERGITRLHGPAVG